MVVRRGSVSTQALQDDPIDTYSLPSLPNRIVRVTWTDGVELGRSATFSGSPAGRPSAQRTRTMAGVVAMYKYPSLNARLCAFGSPVRITAGSARPSLSWSGSATTSPRGRWATRRTPSGLTAMNLAPARFEANTDKTKPGGA